MKTKVSVNISVETYHHLLLTGKQLEGRVGSGGRPNGEALMDRRSDRASPQTLRWSKELDWPPTANAHSINSAGNTRIKILTVMWYT